MKRNKIKARITAAVLAAGCLCCGAGLTAAAVSVHDVANKARELGFPEAQVQQGYSYWATGEFTQADLDAAWAYLMQMEAESNQKFDSIFENESSGSNTGTPTEPSTQPSTGQTDTSSSAVESTPSAGTVSSSDFINMTLDEKIAYVNSMSPQDKDAFLKNLSPEERKSIIKQMSISDKADLMEGYIGFAEQMGMHVSVDNISDENISVTIRDKEGIVIDQSAVGITIDETGISYTGLFAAAAVAVVLALGGIAALYRYICRSDETAQ